MIAPAGNRAARYARISKDLAGDEHGVSTQLAAQARKADQLGYQVVMTEDDNDISALTGRHRPGYEAVMAAAANGEIDVILVFQTSRFWRNRRERAEGIEILRKARVSIVATMGPSLDMSTASGRSMAAILGEFDTMEVEVKGERQAEAFAASAKAGKRRAGTPRPFGWERDHERCTRAAHRCEWRKDPAEAAGIEAACRLILGGGTVSGVMREWEQLGLRPAHAPFGPLPEHPWTRRAIRVILSNPALAGLPVYRGEIVALDEGAEIGWPPIVGEETWRAVQAVLGDPSRTPPKGVRTLLGGLALCPCGNTHEGTLRHDGERVYRCTSVRGVKVHTRIRGVPACGTEAKARTLYAVDEHGKDVPQQVTCSRCLELLGRSGSPGHVSRAAAPCDEFVAHVVVERLSRDDAVDLLRPPETSGTDVAALREQYQAIARNLDEMAADAAVSGYSKSQLAAATRRGHARMGEIDAELAAAAKTDVLAGLVGAPDLRAVWDGLDLSRQRAVIRTLMRVTLGSPGKGKRAFDPETVRVEWVRENNGHDI